MLSNDRNNILLLEDHHEAYFQWKKRNLLNQTLIHIDAHLDYEPTYKKNVSVGNFLYFCIKERIVKTIYWVIPGTNKDFEEDLYILKGILAEINQIVYFKINDYSNMNKVVFRNGVMHTKLGDANLTICTLDSLPVISRECLLDIDIDYFVIQRLSKANPLVDIGKRKQWIKLNRFISTIKDKIKKIKLTTIVYSVNGGYTPIEYKVIGDKIAKKMGLNNKALNQRLLAGKYFIKYRQLQVLNKIKESAEYFKLALFFNTKYFVPNNNYGQLYSMQGNFDKAHKEFSDTLGINPQDIFSMQGLGMVNLYKNNFSRAKKYFNKILKLNPQSQISYLYLAYIEYNLGKFTQSKKYLKKHLKFEPDNIVATLLVAKLYEHEKKYKSANNIYLKISEYNQPVKFPKGIELLI